ncbi:hypothetical protein [Tomitella gaofuii]|uniref:hypothetical protein n=1 Tax=Tomitella gaofuii TaxID=2760083 RepID=UPI0015FD5F32|nr:hypothetical protein [Tomitella gaofuii]
MTITRTEARRRVTWELDRAELVRATALRRIRENLDTVNAADRVLLDAKALATASAGIRMYGEAVALLRGGDGDIDADDVDYWTAEAEAAEREGEQGAIARIIECLTEPEGQWVGTGDLSVL